jgi:type IV secretion system protein TrbL
MVSILLQAAPLISDPSDFTAAYEALWPTWMAAVTPYANEMFYALAFLDLAVFGWTLIRRHGNNIQGAILSTTNRLVLIGAFLALLMNGPTWMVSVINMFIQVGKGGSGVSSIQPSVVGKQGIQICFALLSQGTLSGALAQPVVAFSMVIAAFAILVGFIVIVVEFVTTKVQTFLVLGMGFFFLAFGGSSWTRNYVERYFSYAFSAGIRLMTLYFLVGAGTTLSSVWLSQAQQAPWSLDGIKQAWIIMIGALLYGVLCYRAPAIAAQILGGGPNLSHNEIWSSMGQAVQAGVTTAMVATGVGSAAGAAVGGGSAASSGAAAAKGTAGSAAGGSTPASKPPSSNGGSNGNGSKGASAYQTASAVSGALRSAGSGGNHQVHTPAFKGFGGSDD